MGLIGTLNQAVQGNVIDPTEYNQNMDSIRNAYNASAVLTDVARTIAVKHTISLPTDEHLRFDHSSPTGGPYIAWAQGGTLRATVGYSDAGDEFFVSNDFGPISFWTGPSVTKRLLIKDVEPFVEINLPTTAADHEALRIIAGVSGRPHLTFYTTSTQRAYLWWDHASTDFQIASPVVGGSLSIAANNAWYEIDDAAETFTWSYDFGANAHHQFVNGYHRITTKGPTDWTGISFDQSDESLGYLEFNGTNGSGVLEATKAGAGLFFNLQALTRMSLKSTAPILQIDSPSGVDEILRLKTLNALDDPQMTLYQAGTKVAELKYYDSLDLLALDAVLAGADIQLFAGTLGQGIFIAGGGADPTLQIFGTGEIVEVVDASPTGDPFITFKQDTVEHSYIGVADANNSFYLWNERGRLTFFASPVAGGGQLRMIINEGDTATPIVDIQAKSGLIALHGSDSQTNLTDKVFRVAVMHRTNAEEPVAMITGNALTAFNTIQYGGGQGVMNAATDHVFYTAATTTTLTGTGRVFFKDSAPTVRIFSGVDDALRLDRSAAAGNIHIEFAQSGTERGIIGWSDADTGLLYNAIETAGKHRFLTEGTERAHLDATSLDMSVDIDMTANDITEVGSLAFSDGRKVVTHLEADMTVRSHTGDTVETTLESWTIPANLMGTAGGFRARIWGNISNPGGGAVTIRLKQGTTAFGTHVIPASTSGEFLIEWDFFNNASATAQRSADRLIHEASDDTVYHRAGSSSTGTKDTTGALTYDVTVQLANSADTARIRSHTVDVVPG